MMPQTYTYTWTQTRLETIQDQFHYLLTYADVGSSDNVVYGVGEKAIRAVGIFGCDASGLRVIEVELRVDWSMSAQLTLTVPTITSGLSGWDGKQAPEVKVAGRRFASAARELRLKTNYWITLVPHILNDPTSYSWWKKRLNIGGTLPAWKSSPRERDETLLDLGEASVYIRRAGSEH